MADIQLRSSRRYVLVSREGVDWTFAHSESIHDGLITAGEEYDMGNTSLRIRYKSLLGNILLTNLSSFSLNGSDLLMIEKIVFSFLCENNNLHFSKIC